MGRTLVVREGALPPAGAPRSAAEGIWRSRRAACRAAGASYWVFAREVDGRVIEFVEAADAERLHEALAGTDVPLGAGEAWTEVELG